MTDSKAAFGLRLSRIHFPIRALGFGRRIGLWVQGCSIGCRGCMSLDTWPKDGELTDIDTLVQEIDAWISVADGISVTGGEPLEQAEPLAAFLKAVRPKLTGDVVLFTGHPIESLPRGSGEVLKYVDTLIAGPFEASLPDSRPLSGSQNQTIRFMTPWDENDTKPSPRPPQRVPASTSSQTATGSCSRASRGRAILNGWESISRLLGWPSRHQPAGWGDALEPVSTEVSEVFKSTQPRRGGLREHNCRRADLRISADECSSCRPSAGIDRRCIPGSP